MLLFALYQKFREQREMQEKKPEGLKAQPLQRMAQQTFRGRKGSDQLEP